MLADSSRGLQRASNTSKTYSQTDLNAPTGKHAPALLIVDDEEIAHERLSFLFSKFELDQRLRILHATSVAEAISYLSDQTIHVMILDKNLGGERSSVNKENGIEAIPEFLRIQPHLHILMLTGSHEIPDVVRAMHLGAFNYIPKETPDELFIAQVEKALQTSRLKMERERLSRSISPQTVQLGGHSRAFKKLLRQGESFVRGTSNLLLLGPTGSGKTQFVKWFHEQRCTYLKQDDLPYFQINVATFAKNLIESELFGHEKTAFTGAGTTKQGLFEVVENGTLFLDEIGELSPELQAKLLTVIEERSFYRVGGTKELRSRARIIFATHKNLEKMVGEGTFREDLYDRISTLSLEMPALSERREDIPDIIRAMLPEACKATDTNITFDDLPSDFIEYLQTSQKIKNIRVLGNQLQLLLMSAPRDPRDNPVFTNWKNLGGFSDAKKVEIKESSQGPISYEEIQRRSINVMESNFPGVDNFLKNLKIRLIREAIPKFDTQRELARTLGMGETALSMFINSHSELKEVLENRGKGKRGRDFGGKQ